MKQEIPLVTDYYGDMGEVLTKKVEEDDYIVNTLLRETAAERKRQIDEKLAAIGKSHPDRGALVAEGQSLSRLLRVVNSAIKRKNVAGQGHNGAPIQVQHNYPGGGITAMEMWAGLAMHALLSRPDLKMDGSIDDTDIAKTAWRYAELMDDEGPE